MLQSSGGVYMKRILSIFLCALILAGCSMASPVPETLPETAPAVTVPPETQLSSPPAPTQPIPADPVEIIMQTMPLTAWVGQLFLVGADPNLALKQIEAYQPGGFLLFSHDFEGPASETIARYQQAAAVPMLIAVDEEGGTVTRVSRHLKYRSSRFPSPRELFEQGGMDLILSVEEEKCILLSSLGVNVNLGPVCDITTDPGAFMYQRSLGQDAETTAAFVSNMVQLTNSVHMGSALKHFPGYGNNVDTHTGIATDSRTLSQLERSDLIPFQAGIDSGCGAILVSHTIVEAFDPQLPASLSPSVHSYLRETMGFDGVIITDDLNMQAISDQYGAGEAAVMAVLAGNDLLCCTSFIEQYEAVLAAVLDGRIDFDILKNAVSRVLRWKLDLGLMG